MPTSLPRRRARSATVSDSEITDFARGCAGKRIGPLLFATLYHPAIFERVYAGIALLAAASLYSPLQYLVRGHKPLAGQQGHCLGMDF